MAAKYQGNVALFAGAVAGIYAHLKRAFDKTEDALTGELNDVFQAEPVYLYEAFVSARKEEKRAQKAKRSEAPSSGGKKGKGGAQDASAFSQLDQGVLHVEMQLLNDFLEKLEFPVRGTLEIYFAICWVAGQDEK